MFKDDRITWSDGLVIGLSVVLGLVIGLPIGDTQIGRVIGRTEVENEAIAAGVATRTTIHIDEHGKVIPNGRTEFKFRPLAGSSEIKPIPKREGLPK